MLFSVAALIFFLRRAINNHFLAGDICITGTRAVSRYSPDIQRLTTAAVITYALCELMAILGLIQYFLCGNTMDFYVFMLISLFFFSVYFPMKDPQSSGQAGIKCKKTASTIFRMIRMELLIFSCHSRK